MTVEVFVKTSSLNAIIEGSWRVCILNFFESENKEFQKALAYNLTKLLYY